jgi:osmotically-inducible protein OsmY
MKSNSELQQDVIDELRWDPSTRDCEIGVAARDGVVTLSGEVSSYAQKLAAEAAAERVAGVRALAEDLSDTDLAHACLNALKWDVDVPDDRLQLKVENGWVTVEGTVSTHFQRQAAERAVRYLTGVKGIINHAVVKPAGVSTTEVGRKIKAALHRSAELDASRIQVETHDGRVTLKGTVRSWAERTDAERAAWSAPGVTAIDDQIVVGV